MRCQCREGRDGHIVSVVSDLGSTLILHGGHDLRSGLAVLIRDRTLWMAVVHLVLSTSSVLDVVAIAIFMLHDVTSLMFIVLMTSPSFINQG
jgi:hypothetical protein